MDSVMDRESVQVKQEVIFTDKDEWSQSPLLTVKTEREELEEPVRNTTMVGIEVPAITKMNTIQVKFERMFDEYEDGVTEEECREEIPKIGAGSIPLKPELTGLDGKNIICSVTLNHEERTEQRELPEKIDKPVITKTDQVEIKDETSLYDDNITIEECSIEQQIALQNKSLIHKWKHDEQTKQKESSCGLVERYSVRASEHLKEQSDFTTAPDREQLGEDVRNNIYSDYNINGILSNINVYKCDECNKSFNNKIRLIRHIREHSNENPYKCNVRIKRHGHILHRVLTGKKLYKCDVCMKCFDQKCKLNLHFRIHTGDKPYKCDICMKCFEQKRQLNIHYRIHTGDKPFKCDVCMKCFRKKSQLSIHHRVHTGDKPYTCDECLKCFTQRSALTIHRRIHSGIKPYKCDVCMKCFNDNSYFKKHILIHTPDKPYKCDVCNKCFRRMGHLKKHHTIHTGEKPYKCDICMKCFNAQDSLNRHIRIHTNDKPYKCDACVRSFTQKSNYNKHQCVLATVKPYYCDACKTGFKYRSGIIRHITKRICEKRINLN